MYCLPNVKALFSAITFLFIISPFAQSFEWAISMGGESSDVVNGISIASPDEVYSAGYFQGSVDFDPGADDAVLSTSQRSTFVQKEDDLGNFIWAKSVVGILANGANSIATDSEGNVVVAGYYQANADFDPGPDSELLSSVGMNDAYALKLNAAGDFIWAKGTGGFGNEITYGVTVDDEDNIISIGTFEGEVDFDPGAGVYNLTSHGNLDVFIQKLDADGNFLWARSIGGSELDMGNSIVTDADGNIYMSGFYGDLVDFDPGPGVVNLSGGGESPYVLKLDASGDFVWAVSTQGGGSGRGYALDLDSDNNVVLTGHFSGEVDFDPGADVFSLASSAIYYDVFVLKIDNAGEFIWAKSFGSNSSFDAGRSLVISPSNDVWITGSFQGTVDFDPGAGVNNLASSGGRDAFIQWLDADGELVNPAAVGGISEEYGYAIDISLGAVYVGGFFAATADFDPSAGVFEVESNGSSDAFLLKLSSCEPVLNILTETACGSYTSPEGEVYTESGLYQDTLTNILGCDSVVLLDLTILSVITTVTQTDNVLTSDQAAATYQWVDCWNDYEPIGGATDQSYEVTDDGGYAVIISIGDCSDTSDCFDFLHFSIEEPEQSTYTIYPNPTKKSINILLEEPAINLFVRIYSISGKLVYEKSMSNQMQVTIPLEVEEGLYLLELEQENGKVDRVKIVKE